jgi:hypothetical protein
MEGGPRVCQRSQFSGAVLRPAPLIGLDFPPPPAPYPQSHPRTNTNRGDNKQQNARLKPSPINAPQTTAMDLDYLRCRSAPFSCSRITDAAHQKIRSRNSRSLPIRFKNMACPPQLAGEMMASLFDWVSPNLIIDAAHHQLNATPPTQQIFRLADVPSDSKRFSVALMSPSSKRGSPFKRLDPVQNCLRGSTPAPQI